MTILKTYASVNSYYNKQIPPLREPLNGPPLPPYMPDAASERARVRDRVLTSYAIVYDRTIKPGDEPETATLADADAELLRRLWALEDEPVLTLVASKVTDDPADPAFDADAAREAKVTAWLALYDEDPLDVPAPEEGVLPPTPSAGPSAPGAGTQDDDPARD